MDELPETSFLELFYSIKSIFLLGLSLFMLLISGLISGSEVAFFSLSKSYIKELEKKKKQAETLITLIKNPKYLLATILITNNLINISLILLINYLIDSVYKVNFSSAASELITKIIGIGFIIMLFGEIIPKIYASKHASYWSKIMSYPLYKLYKILLPLSKILSSLTKKNITKLSANIQPSQEEISKAVQLTDNINENEKKILSRLSKLTKNTVKHIMVHRVDIFGIDKSTSYTEIKKIVMNSPFSRIPVYKDTLDNIDGILYIKDLLPHLEKNKFNWVKLIKKPFFITEYKKLGTLLKDFQEKKVHFAVISDEYGGTKGIVTLENILEEIVGDIQDEFDREVSNYRKINNSSYIFDAKTSIIDMCRIFKTDPEDIFKTTGNKEVESLAGLVTELSRKILKKNDTLSINDFFIEVTDADKRKIKELKITKK